jgi:hypothetical protein
MALYMQPVRVYKVSCLLLQVGVLGLAGFMYPSSRLFPWPIAGMLNMRTRWVIPSVISISEKFGISRIHFHRNS